MKIKDLTPEEIDKICNKHIKRNCRKCPLYHPVFPCGHMEIEALVKNLPDMIAFLNKEIKI